jgi:hypothetical protein
VAIKPKTIARRTRIGPPDIHPAHVLGKVEH